jgi:hypothetical protein
MTDFRALCAELLQELEHASAWDYQQGLKDQARAALAQPEPQGPPKNCWLDDEPYLCPSPCVFDDPSEVIDNCLEARHLSEKNKPKEACKYYRTTAQPEPQGPTDEELLRCYGLAKRDHCYEGPIDDWPKRAERAATVHGLHAVLARWGRPTIQPVP